MCHFVCGFPFLSFRKTAAHECAGEALGELRLPRTVSPVASANLTNLLSQKLRRALLIQCDGAKQRNAWRGRGCRLLCKIDRMAVSVRVSVPSMIGPCAVMTEDLPLCRF